MADNTPDSLISTGDKSLLESGLYFAAPRIFDVFSIRLVSGDAAVALEDPHSILFSETAAKKYFGSIAFLILIIACINYMNLATARSAKRAREVGMRKVLGASEPGIVRLLTREYIKKVLISSLVAWPLGYLAMSACLRNFICRAGLGTAPFILSGLGGLLVALLAVSYQTLKAASANPAVSLRYE